MQSPASGRKPDDPNPTPGKAVSAALVGASLAWNQEKSERATVAAAALKAGGKDGDAAVDAASWAGKMSAAVPRGAETSSSASLSPSTPSLSSEPCASTRGASTPVLESTSAHTGQGQWHHHIRRGPDSSTASLQQLESLTDAIVAGSLASKRLTPHHTDGSGPASSLPTSKTRPPRLLQTLRQPANSEDEELERLKRSHHGKLHRGRHAHHEGSRDKWREEITPRERRRYEGLWASNRGYLLSRPRSESASHDSDDDDDDDDNDDEDVDEFTSHCVANIVVRELWKRSRLPADELAEIWDLVDRRREGLLSRQEFVVGTWLVDQRLRGRKVPAKVTESVWASANGVSVRRHRARWE